MTVLKGITVYNVNTVIKNEHFFLFYNTRCFLICIIKYLTKTLGQYKRHKFHYHGNILKSLKDHKKRTNNNWILFFEMKLFHYVLLHKIKTSLDLSSPLNHTCKNYSPYGNCYRSCDYNRWTEIILHWAVHKL